MAKRRNLNATVACFGALALGLSIVLGNIEAEALSFGAPVHLAASAPNVVAIEDANKDGKNDIIVGGDGKLWVFLEDGTGKSTKAAGSPFDAGPSPNDLAFGDFNADGKLDVAVANHGVQRVTVLLGDGHGAFVFAPGSPISIASNPHPHGIVTADFNGDKILDLAVDSWGEDKVLVIFGRGDGSFQPTGSKFSTGAAPYQRLRTADVNEDGNPDIITSNWEGRSVSVLLGDGKGHFTLAGGKNVAVPESPFAIGTGDFNADGHPDIVVAHYSGHSQDPSKNRLSLLLGDGRGGFKVANGSPFAVGNYPATVTTGDLNSDGFTDVVVPNAIDNSLTIFLGGSTGLSPAPGSPFSVGHHPHSAAIGDLDGDGKADLVVADFDDMDVLILFVK